MSHPTTFFSEAKTNPDWIASAKIAGDADFVGYVGGDATAGEPLVCLLHHRAARLVGHPQLAHRARVVIEFPEPFAAAGPTEAQWKVIDSVLNSAERRIVQRKLGLLVLLVAQPQRCEGLFYCNDAQKALAALEGARERAAAELTVSVSVLEDPRWDAFYSIWLKHGAPDVGLGPAAAPVVKELPRAHPAVASDELFRKWVRNHPPRCVARYRLTWMMKLEQRGRLSAGFRVADKSGGDVGRVHAHRLGSIDPSEAGREDVLVSPIHVTWKKSNETTQLFDAAVDGYQGEFKWNSAPRGEGVGAPIKCRECADEWFRIAAMFDYHDAAFDLGRDQPKVEIQNYFAAARFQCTCASCGETVSV